MKESSKLRFLCIYVCMIELNVYKSNNMK
jgi:hypothetical protein